MNDFDEAIADLTHAANVDPKNAEVRQLHATAVQKRNELEKRLKGAFAKMFE